jgi:arylsulfatase
MPLSLRPIKDGAQFALLAALWVLATELLYWRLALPSPSPSVGPTLLFYTSFFLLIGLGAGFLAVVMPRLAFGLVPAVVGGSLAFLVFGLRIFDLGKAGSGPVIVGGLLVLVALVTGGVSWLIYRAPDVSTRHAAPTLLLATCLPCVVISSKLLTTTTTASLRYAIVVALFTVGVVPFLLAGVCRRVVVSNKRARPLLWAAWLMPLLAIAICTFRPGHDRPGQNPIVTSSVLAETAGRASLPSIIWITVDAVRADHLSLYGYDKSTTPHLKEFARGATVYWNCLAQGSETTQSVISMLSGTTPYRHGGVSRTRRLPENVVLLPEMLVELGYQTIAQSANPWVSRTFGFGQGFEEFYLYNTDDELFQYDLLKLIMRLAPWQVYRFREHLPAFAYVPISRLVDDTIEILQARDHSRPLFLYLQPIDPHGPYHPPRAYMRNGNDPFIPEDYVSFYDLKPGTTVSARQLEALIARYDGEIAYSDAELGRLFVGLREMGLFDSSMIIITSDHGEHFGEHGLWHHGSSVYQPLLHVPLVVKYPGQQDGRVIHHRVASIDLVPSILRLLGRECATCEGRPLTEAGTDGEHALFAYKMNSRGTRPLFQAVVAGGWKLTRAHLENGIIRDELFHLDIDPDEKNDLLASHAEIAHRLETMLEDYESSVGMTPSGIDIAPDPADVERLRALGYVE